MLVQFCYAGDSHFFFRLVKNHMFNISPRASQKSVECISPLDVREKNVDEIAAMFGTHDWAVESGKPIGESGVLIRYNCRKCDAEGYSVVTKKGTSTSKLIDSRIMNFV